MRALVLNPFVDRITGKFYRKGDVFDFVDARFNEIKAAGEYIEGVETAPAAPAAIPKRKTRKKKGE